MFRADASAAIGGGHITRCLALAESLQRRGVDCVFLTNAEASSVVPALMRGAFEVISGESVDVSDAAAIAARLPRRAETAIVDHYGLDALFESGARSWARSVVAIDDFLGRRHDCDLLVDPTPGRKPQAYAGLVPDRAKVLTGQEFYMLPGAFSRARPAALARRRRGVSPRHLVVACGATDPFNLTELVLNELGSIQWSGEVTVVLSSAAPHLPSVRNAVKLLSFPARLVVDASPSEVASLYCEADLAIGAAGVSTYERCCLGLPTIMLVTADNQRDNAAAAEAAGAVHLLGDAWSLAQGDIAKAVLTLAAGPERLREMSDRAAALCDGAGAERVADVILGGV